MRKGSGLADWTTFKQQVLVAVAAELAAGRSFPGRRRMQQLGYQKLVSSAYRHHGGWASVRARLGQRWKPPVRRPKPVTGYGKYARQAHNRKQTLRRYFGDWICWGVLPPVNVVVKQFPGLVAYYQRDRGGWHAAAADCQLRYGLEARRQRRYCLAVIEALQYHGQHECWPPASSCSPWLRNWRFGQTWSWPDCLASLEVAPAMFETMRAWLREHVRQLHVRRSPVLTDHLQIMNRLVIRYNADASTTRT